MNSAAIARKLPWNRSVELLKTDPNGLLGVAKGAGALSHPNKPADASKALLNAPYDDERQAYVVDLGEDGPVAVHLLNRLDSATSGVVLLALDADVAVGVRKAFEDKRVKKTYEAIVFGVPRKGDTRWKDRIAVKKAGASVRSEAGGGLFSETRLVKAEPLPGVPLMSLLTLMPLTGRTHQLRVQTAKRGCPIVGDRTYGDFTKNKQVAKALQLKRLCLHCVETEVSYKLNGRQFRFAVRCASPFDELPRRVGRSR